MCQQGAHASLQDTPRTGYESIAALLTTLTLKYYSHSLQNLSAQIKSVFQKSAGCVVVTNEETFFTQKVKFLLQRSIGNHKQQKKNNTSRKLCLSKYVCYLKKNYALYNEFTVVSFIKCFQVSDYCFVSRGHRI